MGSFLMEQSYPVGDYGFESGYPITEGATSQGLIGDAPSAGRIIDGGSIDSMLEGGIPTEAGSSSQTPKVPGYYGSGAPVSPVPEPSPAPESGRTVDPPGPAEEDGTSITRPNADAAILSLVLPEEAKVYINGKLTKTTGSLRRYVSRKLSDDREYKYQLKAVLSRNGKEQVRSKLVKMRPGMNKTVRLDFENALSEKALTTTLSLTVPENAKVKLCGNYTNAKGRIRTFATRSIRDGNVWKDYHVSVEFERDGTTHTEERSLDMVAGETYKLVIGADESKSAQIAAR